MGNERNVKQLRGQVRLVTKEILPDILALEKKAELYKELTNDISYRINSLTKEVREQMLSIEKNVTETLTQLNQRSIDIQEFMLRNIVVNNVPPPVPTDVASVVTAEQKAADEFIEENKDLMDDLQAQEQAEKATNYDSKD